ncbi:MAG: glycine/betaine transporter permease [Thermoleophilia bacterium]|nr:glycine/betaine transporter permease [Thermoleophilia bacterium]
MDPAVAGGAHVSLVDDTTAWLTDAVNWSGPAGIPSRLGEHLLVSLVVLVASVVIALPIGMLIGHTGRGVVVAVAVSGGLRSIPTLGLVTLLGIWLGIGLEAPIIALLVLATPPILTGAYAGFRAVDRDVVDTARALGMTPWMVVRSVELPLAATSVLNGLRSATLQIVATVTVAAYVADRGLGRYVIEGLRTRQYGEMLGGSVLVIILALVLDVLFAGLVHLLRPAHVRAASRTVTRPNTTERHLVT